MRSVEARYCSWPCRPCAAAVVVVVVRVKYTAQCHEQTKSKSNWKIFASIIIIIQRSAVLCVCVCVFQAKYAGRHKTK